MKNLKIKAGENGVILLLQADNRVIDIIGVWPTHKHYLNQIEKTRYSSVSASQWRSMPGAARKLDASGIFFGIRA